MITIRLSRMHAAVFMLLFLFQVAALLYLLRHLEGCAFPQGWTGGLLWLLLGLGQAGAAFVSSLVVVRLLDVALGKGTGPNQ